MLLTRHTALFAVCHCAAISHRVVPSATLPHHPVVGREMLMMYGQDALPKLSQTSQVPGPISARKPTNLLAQGVGSTGPLQPQIPCKHGTLAVA